MKSIVEEKLVSFKSLEQKVFRYVCELGTEITRIMLESYDAECYPLVYSSLFSLFSFRIKRAPA